MSIVWLVTHTTTKSLTKRNDTKNDKTEEERDIIMTTPPLFFLPWREALA
jgi:hypothetical protein